MVKKQLKNKLGKKILKVGFVIIQPFLIPIIIVIILIWLVCYITDIFYIGVNNEEESNFKEELNLFKELYVDNQIVMMLLDKKQHQIEFIIKKRKKQTMA